MKAFPLHRVLSGLVPALWAGAALAFSSQNHFVYTEEALRRFGACKVVQSASAADKKAMSEGARAEDTTEPLRRMLNWHYARNDEMPRRTIFPPIPGLIRTDFAHLFEWRVEQMLAAAGKCDVTATLEAAGRVAHFVQDMRVPAHVIPIHHGSVFGHDDFDDFPFLSSPGEVLPETACGSIDAMHARGRLMRAEPLAAHVTFLWKKVLAARAATEALIDNKPILEDRAVKDRVPEDGSAKCTGRMLFWCRKEDIGAERAKEVAACGQPAYPGFGAYRQGPRFGEPVPGCGTTLTKDHYRSYFAPGFAAMLEDTVEVFAYARALAGCGDAGR